MAKKCIPPTPEQEIKRIRKEIVRDLKHWQYLREYGCQDPFWADGVNMNLTRSHMYHDVDYISGMEPCLSLLQRCSFLLLAGDWKNSKGCLCEYGAARAMGMAVSELTKYVELYRNSLTLSINCLHQSVHGQKLEVNPEGAFAQGCSLEKPLTVANQNG